MQTCEQSAAIRKIAVEIVRATIAVAHKYLELCLYIRKNNVSVKLVSLELHSLGFTRQRISDVNRVANASDNLFNEFEARLIGFHKCLDLVAGERREGWRPTEAARIMLREGAVTEKQLEAEVENVERMSEERREWRENEDVNAKIFRVAKELAEKAAVEMLETNQTKMQWQFPKLGMIVTVEFMTREAASKLRKSKTRSSSVRSKALPPVTSGTAK